MSSNSHTEFIPQIGFSQMYSMSEIVTIKSLSGHFSHVQYLVSLICAYIDIHLSHSFYAALLHHFMNNS